ncbi:MAG: hypothetical protein WD200_03760 [Candidatus Andersenbacteria bacterium]
MVKKGTSDIHDDILATHGDLALFAGQVQNQLTKLQENIDERFTRDLNK